jgi:hypothetical protein
VGVSSKVAHNGHVYETFGITKRLPIKIQLLLIRAKTLDKPLTAKCFIHDVSGMWLFIVLLSVLLENVSVENTERSNGFFISVLSILLGHNQIAS